MTKHDANTQTGEITLQMGDDTFTLKYGTNAMVRLEGKTGQSFLAIADQMKDPSKLTIGFLRDIFAAGLTDGAGKPVGDDMAGDVIDAAGGIQQLGELIGLAFMAAFPEAADETGADPVGNVAAPQDPMPEKA